MCSCLYLLQWFMCLVGAEVLWKELCKWSKRGGEIPEKLLNSLMLFVSVGTGGITGQRKTYCVSLIMLFISSTWDVLCTHRHHIVPLGAANHFVWPGSLFCLPPSLSLSPHFCLLILSRPPLSQNLILKKDYWKTTWVISCRPESYPPVEKTPKPFSLSLSLSLSHLHSLSISLYLAIACQQRFGGATTTVGGWWRWWWWWGWGGFETGGGRSLFLSVCLSRSLHRLQQQQQQCGDSEGGGAEMWLPSGHLSAEVRKRGIKEGEVDRGDEGHRGGKV